MNVYAENASKKNAVSNNQSRAHVNNRVIARLVDNRPEAILQRKLQALANNRYDVKHVIQRNGDKPNAMSTGPANSKIDHEQKRNTAPPFQVLATQFEGKYDISMFKDQIGRYIEKQLKEDTLPVIELRMYDGMPPEKVEESMKRSRTYIEQFVGQSKFDLQVSWLRDEAKEPVGKDGGRSQEMYQEFIDTVKSFCGFYKPGDHNIPPVLNYITRFTDSESLNLASANVKDLFGKIGDPLSAVQEGKIMLPIPEAYAFYEGQDDALVEILAGKGSLHKRP